LPLVIRARTFDPANPLVVEVVGELCASLDARLPRVDATRWIEALDEVEGWLTKGEAALLARCVAGAPTQTGSTIVEIGSYKGRSTLLIALAASELGGDRTVVAIDPHTGYHFGDGQDTYDALVGTLQAAGVAAVVDVRRTRSLDTKLDAPIALAFVDGLHDLDSVRADHAHVAAQLVAGGLVAFHDYKESFPGVVEIVDGLLSGGEYELVGWCESLVALRSVRGGDRASAVAAGAGEAAAAAAVCR